jgi:hypothetical protein
MRLSVKLLPISYIKPIISKQTACGLFAQLLLKAAYY